MVGILIDVYPDVNFKEGLFHRFVSERDGRSNLRQNWGDRTSLAHTEKRTETETKGRVPGSFYWGYLGVGKDNAVVWNQEFPAVGKRSPGTCDSCLGLTRSVCVRVPHKSTQ